MNILQLVPGSGDTFYCENCLRDNALTAALRRAGHAVDILPLYLPPIDEGLDRPIEAPIFFGGVNAYLQQVSGLFRRTPRWLDRLFDARWLLRWAGRRSGATRAEALGEMTISMLRGAQGRQAKELDRLVAFLRDRERPDVAVLSNALLTGLARRLRRELGIPVVCWCHDEDAFLDALPAPLDARAWETLADRAGDIAAFVAPSRYYADVMTRRLNLPAERMHVLPAGLDPAGFAPAATPPEAPAIGFLSHIAPGKGLETLGQAYLALRRGGHPRLQLRITGGQTACDEPFHKRFARSVVAEAGDAVRFEPAFDREHRAEFLRSLSVLSVPTRRPEAFGLFVLEALACGVPVVLPRHGAFVELVGETGGGVLCEPNDAEALAAGLDELLSDPSRARALGRTGQQAVLKRYTADSVAPRFAEICRAACGSASPAAARDAGSPS